MADTPAMFLPSETPPELCPERLLGLRVSLNTPVVSTEEVPTGPARAGLAVYEDAEGQPGITLAVRPIQVGQAVFYAPEQELAIEGGLEVGIDAALSFGESLGFLFDDDALESPEPEARERALALWYSLVGDDSVREVMAVTVPPPSRALQELMPDEADELLLDELALEEIPPPPEAPAPAPPAAPGPPSLTKFRAVTPSAAPASTEPPAGERPRRALLARVRLIKRAAKAEEVVENRTEPSESRLLRLLSSF